MKESGIRSCTSPNGKTITCSCSQPLGKVVIAYKRAYKARFEASGSPKRLKSLGRRFARGSFARFFEAFSWRWRGDKVT